MGLFSNNSNQVTSQEPKESVAQARIARLAAMEAQDSNAFTSDLSVNEYILAHRLGYTPKGYVMGTSVYHIGFQPSRWYQSFEMETLTSAMYEARHLAIERMRNEASALGADGIMGVRLRILNHAWSDGEVEFIVEGTAVKNNKLESNDTSLLLPDGGPFTSDLSGQDFYSLITHGHTPRSFVFGTCVYHVAVQTMRQSWNMSGRNMEVPQLTDAVYAGRELAMTRMEDEMIKAGADGIVGVNTSIHTHMWGQHAVEFLSVGTAVVSSPTLPTNDDPTFTISLND